MLWLPLAIHMEDSAALAHILWNHWVSDGVKRALATNIEGHVDAEQLFVFLAAAHDIGKATPVFQAKPTGFMPSDLDQRLFQQLRLAGLPNQPFDEFPAADKTPHGLATQILLENAGFDPSVAVILGGHHGKPPSSEMLIRRGVDAYAVNYHMGREGREKWTAVQRELTAYALALSGYAGPPEIPRPNMIAQALLSGLVIMADWIVSNEHHFPYYNLEEAPPMDQGSLRARIAWKQLRFPIPWYAESNWMIESQFERRFYFSPNGMQTAVEQMAAQLDAPGVLVLEAPMGTGKTEAALSAAEVLAYKSGRTGVFFALPTQATSDGIFPRVIQWISNLESGTAHSIELAHGKAHFNIELQRLKYLRGSTGIGLDEENGAIVHQWFEGRKTAMLADFVVGTIDQLLLAALKQKHVALRHLGLANKVVVIDECHAYDAYMSQYLETALRWLGAYRVPVIVLSATLPSQKRQAVIEAYLNKPSVRKDVTPEWATSRAYPLITCTDGRRVVQRAVAPDGHGQEILLEPLAEESLIDRLGELLQHGGCAGVIVNTVDRAQRIAQLMRKRFGPDAVRLLHSRFLAPDRAAKEEALLAELGRPKEGRTRPPLRIVVGTQVLEQSLDIDFDVLVTDLCPMDLLLQRIGRLHRHERPRPEGLDVARCLVLGLDGETFEPGSKAVYGEYLLMRTRALLPRRLTLPDDIPNLVQNTYDDGVSLPQEPTGYRRAREEWQNSIADQQKRACDFRLSQPWTDTISNLVDWLNTDLSDSGGEAAVRDTDESFEVLLIERRADGLHFLSWVNGGRLLPSHDAPGDGDARELACQRLRLPHALCTPWKIKSTIDELEHINSELLAPWQQSPWLKGELFLILDESGTTNLGGYRLHYNREDGLLYEKKEDANG